MLDDWTLNRQADRHVSRHIRRNPAVRRVRPSANHRALRGLLSLRFGTLLAAYAVVDLIAIVIEVLVSKGVIRPLINVPDETAPLLAIVPGVAITAQTGALAVITLALALVALVAQRDDAAGDVQIYYHHSMALEIAASSLALVAVLAVESAWPMQMAAHAIFGLQDDAGTKFGLTLVHLAWLTLNVAGVARFVVVTLQFVQRPFRERMRMQFVAEALLPSDMRRRLRETIYFVSIGSLVEKDEDDKVPIVAVPPFFGADDGEPAVVRSFKRPMRLVDIRLPLLRRAVRSWWRRSQDAAPPTPATSVA